MSTLPQFGQLALQRERLYVPAIVVACLVVVLAVFWQTTVSMVTIWQRSETFTHGFLVLPMFLYLLWTRRAELETIEPKPFYPALIGIAGAGCIWIVGQVAPAVSVSQAGMMLMVPFAVWAMLGTQVLRALLFPLAFLFFAVPFGEVFVPSMIDWTAHFTVLALQASGVPVYREGNFFMIPSGRWSVVEACSGLRYLIASLMIGCLFAMLMYRSTVRRLAFVAASLVVPIIANWLRAYGVVMLAHLTDNRLATGVDHIIYGWIFFGIVMLALFQVGSWWREDEPMRQSDQPASGPVAAVARNLRLVWPGLAVLAAIAIWQPVHAAIEGRRPPPIANPIAIDANAGWVRVTNSVGNWQPGIKGATVQATSVFEKNGVQVAVYIALFPEQTFESRAITSTNQLVPSTERQWRDVDRGTVDVSFGGRHAPAKSTLVIGPAERLLAWRWYWVDGRFTTSDYAAKIYQLVSRLEGRGDPTAWLVLYTRAETDEATAQSALASFASGMGPAIEAALQTATRPPAMAPAS